MARTAELIFWRLFSQAISFVLTSVPFSSLTFPQCILSASTLQMAEAVALNRGMTAIHLWTPPFRQGKTLGSLLRVVGCCHLSGLRCGRKTAAGLYGSSRTGSRSPKACSKHCGKPWLSQPRLADCCAILSFRSPLRLRDRGQPTPPRPEFDRCRL